jgi:hypothetical protein
MVVSAEPGTEVCVRAVLHGTVSTPGVKVSRVASRDSVTGCAVSDVTESLHCGMEVRYELLNEVQAAATSAEVEFAGYAS